MQSYNQFRKNTSEEDIINIFNKLSEDGKLSLTTNFLVCWDGNIEDLYKFVYYNKKRNYYFDLCSCKENLQDDIYWYDRNEDIDNLIHAKKQLQGLNIKIGKVYQSLLSYYSPNLLRY